MFQMFQLLQTYCCSSLFGVVAIICSWCFSCFSLMFQLLFLVVAIICSWCFNCFILMLQLLLLIVAIYMFMVFQLLQPNVAVVVPVLLHVFHFSFLCCSNGEEQAGTDGGRVVCRGLAGEGAGAGGCWVLWPWGRWACSMLVAGVGRT
jgi:hypothetical protein